MKRRTWPPVPERYNGKQYHRTKYREGFLDNYELRAAATFVNPTTAAARAYFAGWFDGEAARENGEVPPDRDKYIVPVPSKYTSGDAHKAYRAGYRIAAELAEGTTLHEQSLLFAKWREAYRTERSWSSGVAFDEGWAAGLAVCPNTIERPLPPPSPLELPALMPPPRPS